MLKHFFKLLENDNIKIACVELRNLFCILFNFRLVPIEYIKI